MNDAPEGEDIAIILRRRALEWVPKGADDAEMNRISTKLVSEYTRAANEIERLSGIVESITQAAIAKAPVFLQAEDAEWDGEWWAETLAGVDRYAYQDKVEGLMVADREQIPQLAREIFNLGYRQGLVTGSDQRE